MTPLQCQRLFERLQKNNPNPRSDLIYKTPFELLVAVVLSAQTTDKQVNKVTPELFKVADTPERLLALTEEGLNRYIKTIGLHNTKARHLIQTAKILAEKFDSKIPSSREDLESLPGVGRKTANVILNIAFGKATIAVDTHVFRVSKRIGLANGKTPVSVEKELLKNIHPSFLNNAGLWLISHGRTICTARHPKCKLCSIQDLCEYPHKELDR